MYKHCLWFIIFSYRSLLPVSCRIFIIFLLLVEKCPQTPRCGFFLPLMIMKKFHVLRNHLNVQSDEFVPKPLYFILRYLPTARENSACHEDTTVCTSYWKPMKEIWWRVIKMLCFNGQTKSVTPDFLRPVTAKWQKHKFVRHEKKKSY